MTTILGIRKGKKVILASDSQATSGNAAYEVTKIYSVNGYTFAGAGYLKDLQQTERNLSKDEVKSKKKGEKPTLDRFIKKAAGSHTVYLVAFKKGLYSVQDGSVIEHGDGEPVAIGSGGDFALGALAAGATPDEAVGIATEFDIYSGGPVVVRTVG